VASVNSISPVDIGADGVSFTFVFPESVCLMCRCMGPEADVFGDVVGISTAAAWVVCGKAEGVEVLGSANYGG